MDSRPRWLLKNPCGLFIDWIFLYIILKHLILCKKKLSMDTNANESLCQRAEETQMVLSPVILELLQAQTKESLGLTDPSV